ncbi:MAG: DUF4190 domain-containing protein [Phycisphaerales bacterium]
MNDPSSQSPFEPAPSPPVAPPVIFAPPTAPGAIPPTPPAGGLALASMVLGIVGVFTSLFGFLCFIVSPVGAAAGLIAIVLGWISLAKRKPKRGMAITGVITGAAALLFVAGYGVMMWLLLSNMSTGFTATTVQGASSASNMQTLNGGLASYAAAHQGQYPPAVGWEQALQPYIGSINAYDAPAATGTNQPTYIYAGPPPSNGSSPGYVVLYENPALPLTRYAVLKADGAVIYRTKQELLQMLSNQAAAP